MSYEPQRRQLVVPSKIRKEQGQIFEVVSAHQFEKDGVIAKLVHAFKYQHASSLFRILVPNMEAALKHFISVDELEQTLLVPIPLHRKKQNERGYNQAEKLAKALGKMMGLPCINLLKRVRHHESQAKMGSKKERLKNVKGIFELNQTVPKDWRICLVDDVLTTGATLLEARKTLEQAGYSHVMGLTLGSRDI